MMRLIGPVLSLIFFLRVHKRGEMHTVQWGIWQLTDFLLFVTRSNNQNKFCAFLKWTRMKPELPLFFVVRGSSVKPELPNSTWCFFCSINFHILYWVLYLSCNSRSDPSAVTGGRSFLSFVGKKTSNLMMGPWTSNLMTGPWWWPLFLSGCF